MAWEDALKSFAPAAIAGTPTETGSSKITPRSQVAGDGADAQKWIAGFGSMFRAPGAAPPYDIWWSVRYSVPSTSQSTGYTQEYYVGCTLDWGGLNSPSGALYKFLHDPVDVLVPLVSMPNQNENTSVWSFDAAAEMLASVDHWLQEWMPNIRGWAEGIDVSGSDWQGSAAGEFKALLRAFSNQLENLQKQIGSARFADDLAHCRAQLGSTLVALYQAHAAYMASGAPWPANALHDAFLEMMATAQVTIHPNAGPTVTTSYGNPADQAFWDAVLKRAKARWLSAVATGLDQPIIGPMNSLNAAYNSASAKFARGITPAGLLLPPPVDKTGTQDDPLSKAFNDLNDNMSKNMTDMNQGLNDMNKGMSDSLKDMSTGMSDSFKDMGTGMSKSLTDLNSGMSQNLKDMNSGFGDAFKNLGSSTGLGGSPVYDSSGKPLTDAQGNPITVPPGGYISGNHVYDASGNLVTGKDGKPVTVPDGATTHPLSAFDDPLKLPAGSTVKSDGTVVDANGNPVLDSNGNPVVLKSGDKILPDGSVVDENGKPVSAREQLLANESKLLETPTYKPPTYSSPGSTSYSSTSGSGLLPGGFGGTGGGEFLGTRTGLSDKALANGAQVNADAAKIAAAQDEAAQLAREQSAAAAGEEAQMMGRSQATSSTPPMMPPMGGMPGGGPNGENRQRTTWLSEDEEVWGTENEAVSGVIGR